MSSISPEVVVIRSSSRCSSCAPPAGPARLVGCPSAAASGPGPKSVAKGVQSKYPVQLRTPPLPPPGQARSRQREAWRANSPSGCAPSRRPLRPNPKLASRGVESKLSVQLRTPSIPPPGKARSQQREMQRGRFPLRMRTPQAPPPPLGQAGPKSAARWVEAASERAAAAAKSAPERAAAAALSGAATQAEWCHNSGRVGATVSRRWRAEQGRGVSILTVALAGCAGLSASEAGRERPSSLAGAAGPPSARRRVFRVQVLTFLKDPERPDNELVTADPASVTAGRRTRECRRCRQARPMLKFIGRV